MCGSVQGGNTDRESIGEIVWAPAVSNEHVRWPAEALDPLNPPKGRTVPREALAALNQTERLALQHAEQQRARAAIRNSKADASAAAPPPGGGDGGSGGEAAAGAPAGAAAAAQSPESAVAAAEEAAPPAAGAKASRAGKAAPVRMATQPKMLVVYFGTARWAWMERERLLDFEEHELYAAPVAFFTLSPAPNFSHTRRIRSSVQCGPADTSYRTESAAVHTCAPAADRTHTRRPSSCHTCSETLAKSESLKVKKEMPHPRLFDAAVEEARAYWRIRAGAKGAAAAAAAAQVAATNAANVNNMPRCRKCEACVNLLSSGRRRCLLVRAFAAAAAGHTGAQLAILGTKAVGARVQVWWPLDEDWYPGVVTGCALASPPRMHAVHVDVFYIGTPSHELVQSPSSRSCDGRLLASHRRPSSASSACMRLRCEPGGTGAVAEDDVGRRHGGPSSSAPEISTGADHAGTVRSASPPTRTSQHTLGT